MKNLLRIPLILLDFFLEKSYDIERYLDGK